MATKNPRRGKCESFADWMMVTVSVFNRIWFLYLPDLALSVPRLPSIVKFLFFYTIAQTGGLLWGFIAVVLQVLSKRLCDWLVSEAGSEQFGLWTAVMLVGRCYVLFSILRMLFLLAGGLWSLAWEASEDFPTVSRIMWGQGRSGHPAGLAESKAAQRWNTALAVPIAVITFFFMVVTLVPVACARPEFGDACGGSGWLTEQLASADSRSNRMLRLSLVILMIQWGQIIESLIPMGIVGVCKDASCAQKVVLVVLMTFVLTRVSRFAWRPADHVFFGSLDDVLALGVSRHMTDNMLSIILGAWLTVAVLRAPASVRPDLQHASRSSFAGVVMQVRAKRDALGQMVRRSSFSRTELRPAQRDASDGDSDSSTGRGKGFGDSDGDSDSSLTNLTWPTLWRVVSVRYQYTFILSCMGYWLRSCLSPQIGWSFAQVDLMALTFLYPMMSVIIWSATFAVLALKYVRPRWAIVAVGLPSLAVVLVRGDVPIALATLHFLRQVRKLLSTRAMKYAVMGQTRKHAEKRWAGGLLYISVVILIAFFCVLSALTLAGVAQQRTGFYPGHLEFETASQPGNSSLRIGHHAIINNHLFLSKEDADAGTSPAHTYSICNQTWGDLSALDYALLSLAAYWNADDPQLAVVLKNFFPGMAPEIVASSRANHTLGVSGRNETTEGVPWVEVEFLGLGTRVVAVRGTDPSVLNDVVEDIRMWTEPVLLGILAIVFPTVQVWTSLTVDNWVSTTHAFLGVLGLETSPWSYETLVRHLRAGGASSNGSAVRHAPRLTGHSLGGGLAQIAAALTGSSVFAISPPGLLQSFMKYFQAVKPEPTHGVGAIRAIHQRSVSVVVEGDWVSRFDHHAGFVQTLACDRDDLSLLGGCHLLESTICHLLKACGDPRGRWTKCRHEFDPHGEGAKLLELMPERAMALFRQWLFRAEWPGRAALLALCVVTAFNLVLVENSAAFVVRLMKRSERQI